MQSYNSWRTKEVLTNKKKPMWISRLLNDKSLLLACVRVLLRFLFWYRKMVCLSGRQLIRILVNIEYPIRMHRKCIYCIHTNTHIWSPYNHRLDNKFIEYYLLNDFFFAFVRHPTNKPFFKRSASEQKSMIVTNFGVLPNFPNCNFSGNTYRLNLVTSDT